MSGHAKNSHPPCRFVQLGESEYFVKLDGGEVDTANCPAKLSKRARTYLESPKRSARADKSAGSRKSPRSNEPGDSESP